MGNVRAFRAVWPSSSICSNRAHALRMSPPSDAGCTAPHFARFLVPRPVGCASGEPAAETATDAEADGGADADAEAESFADAIRRDTRLIGPTPPLAAAATPAATLSAKSCSRDDSDVPTPCRSEAVGALRFDDASACGAGVLSFGGSVMSGCRAATSTVLRRAVRVGAGATA